MEMMRIIGRGELAEWARADQADQADQANPFNPPSRSVRETQSIASMVSAPTTPATHITHITPIVHRMPTGFPSPAEDLAEAPLRLDDLLVQRPAATFFLAMVGDALVESGIFAGDILVVDRSLYPTYGTVVIVVLDGELMARHYCPDSAAVHLLPAHPDIAPISLRAEERARYEIWGVVTGVARRLRIQSHR